MKVSREDAAAGRASRILGGARVGAAVPRTMIGVGGLKLYDIPGVIYPAHMLTAAAQRKFGMTPILSKPPSWSISARQAARYWDACRHQRGIYCTGSGCVSAECLTGVGLREHIGIAIGSSVWLAAADRSSIINLRVSLRRMKP